MANLGQLLLFRVEHLYHQLLQYAPETQPNAETEHTLFPLQKARSATIDGTLHQTPTNVPIQS